MPDPASRGILLCGATGLVGRACLRLQALPPGGERDEFRLAEEVGKRLSWLFPPKQKPVAASSVAAALVHLAQEDHAGTRVVASSELPLLVVAYQRNRMPKNPG